MKWIYLYVAFSLLGGFLLAQTDSGNVHGIFDLSFGMSRDQATETLSSQGFKYSRGQYWIYCMYPTPADTLDGTRVTMYFHEPQGGLYAWDFRFPLRDAPDIQQNVMQVLTDLHGEGWSPNNADSEQIFVLWFLEGNHKVEASNLEDDGFFWVYYTTETPLQEDDEDDWDY